MCFGGTTDEEKTDKRIKKEIEKQKKYMRSVIKLLLLGTGESGKSTFFKQMKIIHLNGYTDDERAGYKKVVHDNILTNAVSLIEAHTERKLTFLPENKERITRILSAREQTTETDNWVNITDIKDDIKAIWQDTGIQECFKRSSEFQLYDNAAYFFNDIDRILGPSYIPTEQDILQTRVKSVGVNEIDIPVNKDIFKFCDVGGQRSERRKWIHCFEGVSAIIFFVSLSEYDQRLYEKDTVNRMSEALQLFKQTVNYPTFAEGDTSIILFLNKKDIFKEKIQRVPINVYFNNYDGPNDYEHTVEYIKQRFVELAPSHKKVFVQRTCATSTENIRNVFEVVKSTIISAYLKSLGMYDRTTSTNSLSSGRDSGNNSYSAFNSKSSYGSPSSRRGNQSSSSFTPFPKEEEEDESVL